MSGAGRPPAARGFDRTRRVRRRGDFLYAQRVGVRVTTPHFILLLARSPTTGPSRLGLVVSRKVGNAVVRNRVKRIVRECFRELPGFVPDGLDLVVIPRAGAAELSPSQIAAEWADVQALVHKKGRQALAKPGAPPHVSPASKVGPKP